MQVLSIMSGKEVTAAATGNQMLAVTDFVSLGSLGHHNLWTIHFSCVFLHSRKLHRASRNLWLHQDPTSGHRHLRCMNGLFYNSCFWEMRAHLLKGNGVHGELLPGFIHEKNSLSWVRVWRKGVWWWCYKPPTIHWDFQSLAASPRTGDVRPSGTIRTPFLFYTCHLLLQEQCLFHSLPTEESTSTETSSPPQSTTVLTMFKPPTENNSSAVFASMMAFSLTTNMLKSPTFIWPRGCM